jgi:c-di-GMP-binding flagellar brake protein YcgR
VNNNNSTESEAPADPPQEKEITPEAIGEIHPENQAAAKTDTAQRTRKHLRTQVAWRGAIQIDSQLQPIKVVNVSEGGVAVLTGVPLTLGQSFQMAMLVPLADDLLRQEQVTLTAKVVYSVITAGVYRTNLQFVNISKAHSALIRKWVSVHGKSS